MFIFFFFYSTVYRKIFTPVLFLLFVPSESDGEFKTGQIQIWKNSQIISFSTKLGLCELKMGQNCLLVWEGENYMGQLNNWITKLRTYMYIIIAI